MDKNLRKQISKGDHFLFPNTFTNAAFTTFTAFSVSFVSALLIASLMLGLGSIISWLLSLFALVISTPCASVSSTTSWKILSSPSMSQSHFAVSRGRGDVGFDDLLGDNVAVAGCKDQVDGERTWMWMMGEAGCEGIVMQSIRSRMVRAACIFSWSAVRMDGVDRRILMPSEALTARAAGMKVEKTKDGTLIRWKEINVRTIAGIISGSPT
jgi:hypothetical protein